MKVRFFALFVFVIVSIGSNFAFAHVLERPPGPIKPEFKEPHKVIEIYLNAVSRGELTVLDQTLDKSMLIPIRVEYVYDLNSAIPRVKVYSELKQPIPIPVQDSLKLHGISASLDAYGHIIEIEAHIRPE